MKTQKEITIRSSAAEYLTFVAATGDNPAKIFADKELTEEATIRNFRIVQTEESWSDLSQRLRSFLDAGRSRKKELMRN